MKIIFNLLVITAITLGTQIYSQYSQVPSLKNIAALKIAQDPTADLSKLPQELRDEIELIRIERILSALRNDVFSAQQKKLIMDLVQKPNTQVDPSKLDELLVQLGYNKLFGDLRLIDLITLLIDRGASSSRALYYAIKQNNLDLVQRLLNKGANPDGLARGTYGSPLLAEAVNLDRPKIAHLLLDYGARDPQALRQALFLTSVPLTSLPKDSAKYKLYRDLSYRLKAAQLQQEAKRYKR